MILHAGKSAGKKNNLHHIQLKLGCLVPPGLSMGIGQSSARAPSGGSGRPAGCARICAHVAYSHMITMKLSLVPRPCKVRVRVLDLGTRLDKTNRNCAYFRISITSRKAVVHGVATRQVFLERYKHFELSAVGCKRGAAIRVPISKRKLTVEKSFGQASKKPAKVHNLETI